VRKSPDLLHVLPGRRAQATSRFLRYFNLFDIEALTIYRFETLRVLSMSNLFTRSSVADDWRRPISADTTRFAGPFSRNTGGRLRRLPPSDERANLFTILRTPRALKSADSWTGAHRLQPRSGPIGIVAGTESGHDLQANRPPQSSSQIFRQILNCRTNPPT